LKKQPFAVALMVAASYSVAPAADAAGGTAIARAPQLTSGRTYAAHFPTTHLHQRGGEFWKVRMLSGDDFSVSGVQSKAGSDVVKVLPIGTDDATLVTKRPVYQGRLDAFAGFIAPRGGTYPVEIVCSSTKACAPVKFLVSITHQLDLKVPREARLGLSGDFTVRVATAEGRPVTSEVLTVDLYGLWKENFTTLTHHVLGSAKAVRGQAVIQFHLPNGLRGRTITLQATAAGDGYRATSSLFCRARVR
jgi:hypothetical protein